MKTILLFLVAMMFGLVTNTYAQDKYATQTGHVWFISKASETIQGDNKTAASFMDITTGDLAIRMLIKSFKFESALMEEHFNENYMESTKFPKSEFKGKITNLSDINFKKDGVYKAVVNGDLTIHGITNPVTTEGTIEVKGAQIMAKSSFKITIADFKIEIPSLVEDKIAKSFNIEVELTYDKLPAAK